MAAQTAHMVEEAEETAEEHMDWRSVPVIETDHVHAVYDAIAPHWHHTRHSGWPQVERWLAELPTGTLVGDIGCGNGKYMQALGTGRVASFGCDTSANLVDICHDGGCEALVADALTLPYRSNAFGAVICIAVLHHLSNKARRIQALREIIRVCRPGGRCLVYAWALEQDKESKRQFGSQDVMVPWHMQSSQQMVKEVETAETKATCAPPGSALRKGDTHLSTPVSLAPGGQLTASAAESILHGVSVKEKHAVVYQRYCHVYKKGELELLLQSVEGAVLEESFYDASNWCVSFRKTFGRRER